MILVIDTSTDKTVIALGDKEKIINKKIWQAHFKQSETLLPAIDKLLKKNKISLKDLEGIVVVSGPGSYTGLRAGIACANALGYSLKIPVVGIKKTATAETQKVAETQKIQKLLKIGYKKLKKEKFRIEDLVVPFYGRKPHITKSKKKF